jgi:hypothetical protein
MLQNRLVSLEERQRLCQHQRGLPGQMMIVKATIVIAISHSGAPKAGLGLIQGWKKKKPTEPSLIECSLVLKRYFCSIRRTTETSMAWGS